MSCIVELICRREPGRTATARKANSYKSASPGREITLIFIHCAAHKHTHTHTIIIIMFVATAEHTHKYIIFFPSYTLCECVCFVFLYVLPFTPVWVCTRASRGLWECVWDCVCNLACLLLYVVFLTHWGCFTRPLAWSTMEVLPPCFSVG